MFAAGLNVYDGKFCHDSTTIVPLSGGTFVTLPGVALPNMIVRVQEVETIQGMVTGQ
jgi:hypothetical protein